MGVGEAAPCAWEAVGSGTVCGVDGQVALGGRGAGAGHEPVGPRRSPALGPLAGLWSHPILD